MALRELLVHVDKTKESLGRLRLASELAARHGSRLIAHYAREWSQAQLNERKAAEYGLASSAALLQLEHDVEESINASINAVRAELDALRRDRKLEVELHVAAEPATVSLPQHARYADLCLLGHAPESDDDFTNYSLSEKLLFTSGHPVLSVPGGRSFEVLGRHIAVAWNSSRASARSVNDALPLIELAERVTVITINPKDVSALPGALPTEQIMKHLARHGAKAELIQLEHGGSIGDRLQEAAKQVGADMLVAGAFGHPRLWERLLGGATRDLLDRMQMPIMMSN